MPVDLIPGDIRAQGHIQGLRSLLSPAQGAHLHLSLCLPCDTITSLFVAGCCSDINDNLNLETLAYASEPP